MENFISCAVKYALAEVILEKTNQIFLLLKLSRSTNHCAKDKDFNCSLDIQPAFTVQSQK